MTLLVGGLGAFITFILLVYLAFSRLLNMGGLGYRVMLIFYIGWCLQAITVPQESLPLFWFYMFLSFSSAKFKDEVKGRV
jgi:hypothetical protein